MLELGQGFADDVADGGSADIAEGVSEDIERAQSSVVEKGKQDAFAVADLLMEDAADGVSLGEAIAHELAQAWLADPGLTPASRLPLRELVGDPCDLSRRIAIPAITTLTLRQGTPGDASFLLHWRDPAKVTHAGGMYQVMPVGIFQPVDDTAESERNDLSLWRCMVREFSEELLGTPEDYRALGSPVGYGRWALYQSLTAARQAGKLNVACLGIGVDPLSFAVDILTVAVFDGGLFDATFGGLVTNQRRRPGGQRA